MGKTDKFQGTGVFSGIKLERGEPKQDAATESSSSSKDTKPVSEKQPKGTEKQPS